MRNTPKKAFARVVEKLKLEPDVWGDPPTVAALDRLTSDERMQSVWQKFAGDEDAIAWFLSVLLGGAYVVRHFGELRRTDEPLEIQQRGIKRAIKEISTYCRAQATNKGFPLRLRGLEQMLQELGEFVQGDFSFLRSAFSENLPKSRKHRPNFLMRVYVPHLMARVTTAFFGQPHYQCIADTVNCFFGLSEDKGIAAAHVRDAQRRHGFPPRMTHSIIELSAGASEVHDCRTRAKPTHGAGFSK